MNHHPCHQWDVKPLLSVDAVVIHLNLHFTLEDPITVFSMCHRYVFGVLDHSFRLHYVGVNVFGA